MTNLSIMKRPAVESTTGLSRSSLYAKMASGDFPQAVKLGRRSVGWVASEVQAWLQDRVMASRGGI